jgi:succinate dehydrogenase / fumarate reductase iron-sulfur subunit
MYIQKNPVMANGKKTTPVNWESSCLEEVCGSCTMIINGKVRQACSALIKTIIEETGSKTVTLEPMSKFPIIRDLQVDRQRMFEGLKQVKAWTPLDGGFHHQAIEISTKQFTEHELSQIKLDAIKDSDEFIFDEKTRTITGTGTYLNRDLAPQQSPKNNDMRYTLSECMTCGCCIEACPNVQKADDAFVGAAIISQARYFNAHPQGAYLKEERLEALMQDNGIGNCGNAQMCVQVCPKHIPLTESIVDMMRQTTNHALFGLF